MSVLFRATSQFHEEITVDDNEQGAITLRIGGRRQSTLDGTTGLDAVQPILDYLHLPIAIRPDARRALLIGLGGGVLAKRMWHDYPDLRIDAVELDPVIVDVAREYFGLPPDNERLGVHVDDGRRFVEESRDIFDIMVIDAYFVDAMPWGFATDEFLEIAAEHLSRGGVLAYNLVSALSGDRSLALRRILAGVQRHFVWTAVFPVGVDCGGGRQNLVMAASTAPVDRGALLASIRSRANGLVTVHRFETFGDAMIDASAIVSGTEEPFLDSEAPGDDLLRT